MFMEEEDRSPSSCNNNDDDNGGIGIVMRSRALTIPAPDHFSSPSSYSATERRRAHYLRRLQSRNGLVTGSSTSSSISNDNNSTNKKRDYINITPAEAIICGGDNTTTTSSTSSDSRLLLASSFFPPMGWLDLHYTKEQEEAALDLSAPASSLLVKNRKNAWIQLAGHPGSFAPAGPNTIWKKRIAKENYETLAYQALIDFPKSRTIMPAFYREVEFKGEYFIEMEDLLHHFNDPSIMDIKMGHRTFLEAEVKNPVLRKDLFEKMTNLDPDAPSEDEKTQGAITKLRYMQFREHESSTASMGFRIEAIRMSGQPPNKNLKKVKSKDEVSYFIETFTKHHECVIPILWERLKDIREKFEDLPFFHTHEIIGSSLLIMFDSSNHAGAWMIDFAKTIPVPDLKLTHRSQWQLGNHEDGYLFGLDNLIKIFGEIVQKQQKESSKKDANADARNDVVEDVIDKNKNNS